MHMIYYTKYSIKQFHAIFNVVRLNTVIVVSLQVDALILLKLLNTIQASDLVLLGLWTCRVYVCCLPL